MPIRQPHHLRRPKLTWKQWLAIALGSLLVVSIATLLRVFYLENTVVVPSTGGTYIEGSVGTLFPLNPWFTITNDVNRDIVSLVFSGLLKYNPETKEIVEDLATMKISTDGRIYTLSLKDDIFWHDHTEESPHPVTIEDVLFTYRTIQDPAFPNTLLHQNFQGVEIEQLDERSVRFKLDEPYRFFPSNLTLGLLPANAFEGIPVDRLDQTVGFGFNPIGAGPYKFLGLVQTELSTEVTLERFDRSIPPQFHLDLIVFRIFPDYTTLLSDLRNLQGVRLVPRNDQGEPLVPRRFEAKNYTLPQYVALFLNNENPFIQDDMIRLALQLGTNKQDLIAEINETNIVDTPLLEIADDDWRFSYDPNAAQGALFNSDWHLPEKIRLQRLLEIRESNSNGDLKLDNIVFLESGAVLTVTGSIAAVGSTGGTLSGLPLYEDTQTGAWIAAIPTVGTGAINKGMNILRLYNDERDIIDTFYLWRTSDKKEFAKAAAEQDLVDKFIASKNRDTLSFEQITVADMFLEDGMLRLRKATDPTDIRVNKQGQKLSLKLLTSPTPPQYPILAKQIKDQWRELGVHVGIEIPETREEFEEKMLRRDYDVLLFGQSLLDNLDSYPYWHSTGIQKDTENRNELELDAYNLSQYSSLESDTLLELIRKTGDLDERKDSLVELREILKDDVPAIFLYSPIYTFGYQQDLRGIDLGNLSLHSDRFLTLHKWYVRQERVFKPGNNWFNFPSWFLGLFF